MDLAVVMRPEVLADKLEDGRLHGRAVATWNTRRLPTRLTPGWSNRLFVACQGRWRGYFPLSGDVFWNPRDETGALRPHFRSAPMDTDRARAMSFVPRLEISRVPARCGAGGGAASCRPNQRGRKYSSKNFLKKRASQRWRYFPHRLLLLLPHRP
jgi:hypothetical protein